MRLNRSIRQLTVLGFLLAVVPLMLALASAMYQVDRLAVAMQQAMQQSARAIEASRLITSLSFNLERSAEQYAVLDDETLLQRYRVQREKLHDAIAQLASLPLTRDLRQRIEQLQDREQALYARLQQWRDAATTPPRKIDPELKLGELLRPIPQAVIAMVARNSEAMNGQVTRIQRMLLWQVVGLIPLALLLAVVFSVLITRPLRGLGREIRRLGAGELKTAVEVSGPQDIRELGGQLDWMRQRLALLDQQKQHFLQHMSHELKTPLTAIREGSELLSDGVVGMLNAEQREVVDILRENSLQLQSQVESLLNFNLALTQDRLARIQPVDFRELLPAVIDKYRLALRKRDIRIIEELDELYIEGVREQLRSIVDNLFSNAVKYSPEGGTIRLRLRRDGERACLDVIDQGSGVDSADRSRIFEPFYQGHSACAGPVKGTGLGLAIAGRYARLHGGDIELLNTREGAHFRLCLPLVQTGEPHDPTG